MSDSEGSILDDLLHIYTSLRRLGCINRTKTVQLGADKFDVSIFSRKFLLKLLNERLADLSEFSREICDDLFKQIGVKPKKVDQAQLDQLNRQGFVGDTEHEPARYPEFDEYFHHCVFYLHDFFIELKWHEVDIDSLSSEEFGYVAQNLKNIEPFMKFNSQLINRNSLPLKKVAASNRPVNGSNSPKIKSSLGAAIKTPGGRSTSPTMRRRVRFDNSVLTEESQRQAKARQRKLDDHDSRELHSIFALDLLIYSIEIFVKNLETRFRQWTSSVKVSFGTTLGYIFDSRRRVQSKQLQLVAKSFKIFLDVHLTILDYLNEIKTTYLIHYTFEVISARDYQKTVVAYKEPRISAYVRHCLELEEGILTSLINQGLELLFGLAVCEINHPPVELNDSLPPKSREEADRAHGNMLGFLNGWLQVEDVLFGYARPRRKIERAKHNDLVISRPKLLSKSTLSFDSTYASSSQIMVQMDNLCDFLKTFLSLTITRLRHPQHIRYFLDHMATGLLEFFKIISEKIKSQMKVAEISPSNSGIISNGQTLSSEKSSGFEVDKNCMAAKIRALKLLHIANSAEKLLRDESKRTNLKLASLEQFLTQIQRFSEICSGLKITHLPIDPSLNKTQRNKTLL